MPPKTGKAKGKVDVFATNGGGEAAIARGTSLELWSSEGKKLWAQKGGPFLSLAICGDRLAALGEDGALVFVETETGQATGALRLASTEPADSWRLAHVDAAVVVLALGDWLVWIDACTRKTIRRVRVPAKVSALVADRAVVVCGLEDGKVNAFRADSGEPRANFAAHDGNVATLALLDEALV